MRHATDSASRRPSRHHAGRILASELMMHLLAHFETSQVPSESNTEEIWNSMLILPWVMQSAERSMDPRFLGREVISIYAGGSKAGADPEILERGQKYGTITFTSVL